MASEAAEKKKWKTASSVQMLLTLGRSVGAARRHRKWRVMRKAEQQFVMPLSARSAPYSPVSINPNNDLRPASCVTTHLANTASLALIHAWSRAPDRIRDPSQ